MRKIKSLIFAALCGLMLASCSDNGGSQRKIMFEDLDSTTLEGIRDYLNTQQLAAEYAAVEEEMNALIDEVTCGYPLNELAMKAETRWYIEAGRNGNICTCRLRAEIEGLRVTTNFEYASNSDSYKDYLTNDGQMRFFNLYKPNTYKDGYVKEISFQPGDFKPAAVVMKVD